MFQTSASSKLAAEIAASPAAFSGRSETSLLDVITGSQTPVGLPELVKKATDGAFEAAAGDAMFVGVAAAVLGLVLALLLLGRSRGPGAKDAPASGFRG